MTGVSGRVSKPELSDGDSHTEPMDHQPSWREIRHVQVHEERWQVLVQW